MLKHAGGRPTEYYPELCEEIVDFFRISPTRTLKIITTGKNDYRKEEEVEVANPLPHIIDFAHKIGVTYATISNWVKKYPEFFDAYKEVKLLREKIIEQNALKGLYNASFSIFDAKNTLGWRDEQHIKSEHTERKVILIKDARAVRESIGDSAEGNRAETTSLLTN